MVSATIPAETLMDIAPVEYEVDARTLERHPLSGVFGDMSPDVFEEFQLVFRDNPVPKLCEIYLYEGKVLDGWHRTRAAIMSGHERVLRFMEYKGGQPAMLAAILNGHRRQLSSKDRAIAMVECMAWEGEQASPAESHLTVSAAAGAANVSVRQLERAKAANRAGLLDYVKQGVMELEDAYDISKKSSLLSALSDNTIDVTAAVSQVRTARRLASRDRMQRQLDRIHESHDETQDGSAETEHVTETGEQTEKDVEIARLNARIDRLMESRDQVVSERETLTERYIAMRNQRDSLIEVLNTPGIVRIMDPDDDVAAVSPLLSDGVGLVSIDTYSGGRHAVRIVAVEVPALPDVSSEPRRASDSAWLDFNTDAVVSLGFNPVDFPTVYDIGNHRPEGFGEWSRGDKHRWTRLHNRKMREADTLKQDLEIAPG